LWIPRVRALGHEVICSASFAFIGAPLDYGGITVLPGVNDVAGNDVLYSHYSYHDRDLLITLCDVFALDPGVLRQMSVAHWVPVDGSPPSAKDLAVLQAGGGTPLAMSRYGMRQLQRQGYKPLYLPHGIDTEVFQPALNWEALRDRMEIGPETFVIGINAFNKDPVRKAFQEQFLAFARFRERHPDSALVVHSMMNMPGGTDLSQLAAACGIAGNIKFPDQYAYATGLIGPEHLSDMYNVLDLYSNCSYGEGFGLTIVEAQACGTPVVVTDCSAMSELCGSGWKVQGSPFWVPSHQTWWTRPDIGKIEEAYEAAWQARENGDMPAMRKQAREFALQYDADRVQRDYLEPVLAELEERQARKGGDV
jgi:glycosyltransferase involved in cell wall biosynthesis